LTVPIDPLNDRIWA